LGRTARTLPLRGQPPPNCRRMPHTSPILEAPLSFFSNNDHSDKGRCEERHHCAFKSTRNLQRSSRSNVLTPSATSPQHNHEDERHHRPRRGWRACRPQQPDRSRLELRPAGGVPPIMDGGRFCRGFMAQTGPQTGWYLPKAADCKVLMKSSGLCPRRSASGR
jgi:hypothetical protein